MCGIVGYIGSQEKGKVSELEIYRNIGDSVGIKHTRWANHIRYTILILHLLLCSLYCNDLKAQYLQGSTGLLNIPTADMQPDGTFMGGANYLPSEISPDNWSGDTANYFLNITFLPFLEVGYKCTFIRLASNGNVNQDRAISVKLRALKEAKWYPSIVVGSGDISTSGQNGNITQVSGNNYYSGMYGVATKHFNIGQEQIGISLGYSYDIQGRSYNDGVFCGVSYRPSFYTDCQLMADMKSEKVSIGAAVKLFDHLSLNAFCYDFKAFAGGLRYEVKLY